MSCEKRVMDLGLPSDLFIEILGGIGWQERAAVGIAMLPEDIGRRSHSQFAVKP
jgi:hypothetical protein